MSKELKVDDRILRNEIVRKAAVANMTNIAKQRADLKQGIAPIAPETKSATEISEDRTLQAGDALKNLIDLGFKDSDAQAISSDLTHEQRVAFNRAFPQIQNDFSSRFSVKNATPEFFIEYLKNYLKILKATGGIPNSIGYLQDNLITTPTDLLKLVLTSEYIERLRDILTADYGLNAMDGMHDLLNDVSNALPTSQVISDLNQVMVSDPVLGFESIQDIMKLLQPLPSKKVIQKILDAPHTNAAQKTQIRVDLIGKLDVLEPVAYRNLPIIYRDLATAAAAAAPPPVPVIGAPPPLGSAPIVAPIAVPTGGTPPATPIAVTATSILMPKKAKRLGILVINNLVNTSTGETADVYLFSYVRKPADIYFALILNMVGGGSSSSSSSSGDILLWGLDISDLEQFFNHYEARIDSATSGTPFNLSSLKPYTATKILDELKKISKDPSRYHTKTFDIAEIQAMTYEQYEPAKIGFGLKSKKSKTKVKSTTGLKPIRLGKGFEDKNDPYKIYDEELKLTPISASDIIKKPPKKPAHKVSEGIDGDDYQKFDDKANRYIALGKYAVNMRQLKKGVLQIVYKSLAPMQTFPSKKISSELQQYLFELLTNQKSLPALYKHVPEDEKKMFEKLAIFAGVFDKLNLPRMNSLEDEKKEMDRFKLLHGEFIAGNDNVSIIRELRNLILKIYDFIILIGLFYY